MRNPVKINVLLEKSHSAWATCKRATARLFNGLKVSRRKQFILFIWILAICCLFTYLNNNTDNDPRPSKAILQNKPIIHSDMRVKMMTEPEFSNAFKYHGRKANKQ